MPICRFHFWEAIATPVRATYASASKVYCSSALLEASSRHHDTASCCLLALHYGECIYDVCCLMTDACCLAVHSLASWSLTACAAFFCLLALHVLRRCSVLALHLPSCFHASLLALHSCPPEPASLRPCVHASLPQALTLLNMSSSSWRRSGPSSSEVACLKASPAVLQPAGHRCNCVHRRRC